MGKTVKGTPGPGQEWWGKRPLVGTIVSRKGTAWWKRYLHKIERREAKKHLRRD